MTVGENLVDIVPARIHKGLSNDETEIILLGKIYH